MKQNKLKFLMSLVLMLCVLPSFSQTFKSKGITYTIRNDSTVGVDKGSYSGRVIIPSQVNYYGTIFTVRLIRLGAFEGCTRLTSVTLPNSITFIDSDAFKGCINLTNVTFGKSVEEIGGWVFEGCKRLTSIIIPNSVTRIGYAAFKGCTGLTSVTIGESVERIGGNAFKDCPRLTKIICKAKTPQSFETETGSLFVHPPFDDFYKPTVYVPAKSIEKYKNDNDWKEFVKIRAIK